MDRDDDIENMTEIELETERQRLVAMLYSGNMTVKNSRRLSAVGLSILEIARQKDRQEYPATCI